MMMRDKPFTRPTIVVANEFIAADARTHIQINKIVLRLGLEADVPDNNSLGIEKKLDRLGRLILARAEEVVATVDGPATLAEAFVREAVTLQAKARWIIASLPWNEVLRGTASSSSGMSGAGSHPLRSALPDEVDLPASDDEMRILLRHFQFAVPSSHLEQVIEAHTRGDWAAANAQLRTFLEALFDDIAGYIDKDRAALPTSENRRAMLADASIRFLAPDRGKWTADGKNYVNGLFKMLHTLHTHGSHPGLWDENHSTFRLEVVLVTATSFLRRLWQGAQ